MKTLLKTGVLAGILAAGSVNVAGAAVGWCGGNWPNSGSTHASNSPITVYFQVWKAGTTTSPGAGANLSCNLFYREAGTTTYTSIAMPYFGDAGGGGNDEFSASIPSSALSGVIAVEFYVRVFDSTDFTDCYGNDQNGFGPMTDVNPGTYNVTQATGQAVDVTFSVDMSAFCAISSYNFVKATGSFTGWDTGAGAVSLSDPDNDKIWTGTHNFASGVNPQQEYKFIYQATGGTTQWEDALSSNRVLNINDTNPTQVLPTVYFNNATPANNTTQAVDVFFQVDMSQVTGFTSVYVTGNFLSWSGTGLQLNLISGSTYGGIYSFPVCTNKNKEYKFTYDDGSGIQWESVSNRQLTIDDSGTTQNLPAVYWNDILPPLAAVSVSISEANSDVVLTWNLDTNATSYKIYRSDEPNFTPDDLTNLLTTLGATNTYTDVGAASSGTKFYYVVKSAN
ncbi:hypothetical protein IT568_01160 [bacterium]|nr:hypothetical protein [bacterium]